MGRGRDQWQAYLPEQAKWSEELALVVLRSEYIYWGHDETWLILLSTRVGDLVTVQNGGRVQARLAVNRVTGEVVQPTQGIPIGEWQTGVLGLKRGEEEAAEPLRTRPPRPQEWERMVIRVGRRKEK